MLKEFFIFETETVKDALKKMEKISEKVLLVVDDGEELIGTISDGDIRRYILKGKSIKNKIKSIYNDNPITINKEDFLPEIARKLFLKHKITLIPIVDNENKVINIVSWSTVFDEIQKTHIIGGKIDLPVVIMAGGKGTRLEPYSKIFPKPLIPIGEKPMIEIIIDEFRKFHVKNFIVILNYKGDMIELYLNSINDRDYHIEYLKEDEFYGTAGGLKMLENRGFGNIIVSNCDVMVKADFYKILKFHENQKASLTIISSIQHHKIPYGVIKFEDDGVVKDITEKPEYTFYINTGIYVLNSDVINYIPEETYFDMTDLINELLSKNKRVITYPVYGKDYVDIGQWDEYKKVLLQFKDLGKI